MITLSTSGNSVIFTFQDNQHYLQNGTIEVPKNSLSLVTDDSNMATFKKSASNDIFLSALYSELGMTKAELETWFEENATTNYGGGGGGGGDVTSAQVQTMIDTSISGKADTSAVTADIAAAVSGKVDSSSLATVATSGDYDDLLNKPTIPTVPTDVSAFNNDAGYITENAISGKADTSAVTAVNNVLTAHTADTTIHVTSSDKSTWSGKQDALVSGTNIKTINNQSLLGSGNITISGGSGSGTAAVEVTQAEYDALVSGGTVDPTVFYIITDATPVDLSGYAQSSAVTEEIAAAVSGKADTSAVTASINAAVSGKVDSSSIVTAVTSASTDSQIPSAKCVYDQLDGLKLQKVTQAEYDALVSGGTVDNNTLYVIS